MKTLEIILRERGFDTSFYKEDIMDSQYLLLSTSPNKAVKAKKNLQEVFCDYGEESLAITQSIDEFIRLYGE